MRAAIGGREMFRADELVNVIGGRLVVGRADRTIDAISTDTRRLPPGALFWALRGERFDGAAFVEEALARGACGAVVPADAVPDARVWQGRDVVVIAAGDPLRALQEAAAAHRARFGLPVVGVTGSNGKTTTKEMAAAILAQRGPVLKTEGNLNNHIGVPLTLFRLGAAHRAAVVELGINHPGEMTRLCEIARPTVGVITNVGHAHLEGFGGLDGVARAKGELFEALGADGVAVVNLDDPRIATLGAGLTCRALTFGLTAGDVRGRIVDEGTRSGTRIEIRHDGARAECVVPVVGRHNAANALAAAAVAVALGTDLESVAKGLERFRPAAMRSELVTAPSGVVVFNDAYNANPSSMERALDTAGRLRGAGRPRRPGGGRSGGPVDRGGSPSCGHGGAGGRLGRRGRRRRGGDRRLVPGRGRGVDQGVATDGAGARGDGLGGRAAARPHLRTGGRCSITCCTRCTRTTRSSTSFGTSRSGRSTPCSPRW